MKTFYAFFENGTKVMEIEAKVKHEAIRKAREILGYGICFTVKSSLFN